MEPQVKPAENADVCRAIEIKNVSASMEPQVKPAENSASSLRSFADFFSLQWSRK